MKATQCRWAKCASRPVSAPADFQPARLRLQEQTPTLFSRVVLIVLLGVLLAWARLGRLDVAAVAVGKLVPQMSIGIVHPTKQEIATDRLVRDGQSEASGQISIHMDTALSEPDGKTLHNEHNLKRLSLRRIDAQPANTQRARAHDDPPELYAPALAQYMASREAKVTIAQAEQRLREVGADYRRELQANRVELATQYDKLAKKFAKQGHRSALMELRAPEAGIVKDLATHTPGTVVQPGAVPLTLVPSNEQLKAEVWLTNRDVGFVRQSHTAKIKLGAYPFQKYGMPSPIEG